MNVTPDADRAAAHSPATGRALLPVALLVLLAGAQVALARTAALSPRKGGGFGMFSTPDDAARRRVQVYVSAPERSEEIAIAPSLEDVGRRAAVLPADFELSRLARRVIAREARNQRPVDTVRIEAWRIVYESDSLAATSRLIRAYVYRVDATASPRP